ncbi:MAG: ADP-ribosylglycohydrolase family protein [Salinivirgaceae bacterium]
MKAETKYKGALKLSAIGDALGWMTEFESSIDGVNKKFGNGFIDKFYNWEKSVGGRFNGYIDLIEKGSYSDDTQLLLSVARSIKPNGKVDNVYFSKNELPAWLPYSRGAGRTIKNAALKMERKSAKWNSNFFTFKAGDTVIDYRESGANGAAMRILPITLANFQDFDTIKEEVFANSIVTHGHSRAILGALIYAYAIDLILPRQANDFNPEAFIVQIGKNFQQTFTLPFLQRNEYSSWINEWNSKSNIPFIEQYLITLNETQELLRNVYKSLTNNHHPNKVLKELGCLEKETKGSGIATVLAGLYLTCKYYKNPIEGVLFAVNFLGSDTDSIAAFTGGLLGALHGQSIIPNQWKEVQDFEYLDIISTRLLAISESKFNLEPNKNEISSNYQYLDLENDNLSIGDEITYNPLGIGKVSNIDRQAPLTKGKYNLIVDIDFKIGQSCRFSKLINGEMPVSQNLNEVFELIRNKVKNAKKDEICMKLKKHNNPEFNEIIIEILKSV